MALFILLFMICIYYVNKIKGESKKISWLSQTAAFISKRSRNSKQLKKYDPLYFSFLGGSYFFNYFDFLLLSEI